MANPTGPATALDSLLVGGIPTMGMAGLPLTNGNVFFVDPVTGNDSNDGSSISPLQTLYKAHAKCTDGNNDVVVLVGNGLASGTARLSTASAQAVDSTVTAGTLVWSKNATHLVGMASPGAVSQRARIAPPTGTYTQATFGSGNFVTVSGQGCIFANIEAYNGFSTGGTNQICWTDTGGRNSYINCSFYGMMDAASAADTGSRSLKISGTTGENTFYHCCIGGDTIARSVANASVEFAGGTPRNTFEDCVFPFFTSNAGVLGILGTGAACMDRWQDFRRCRFINTIKSTSTQMTALASLTNAAPGGLLYFDPGCVIIGITKWGDTNGLANSYVASPVPTAATSGIAVNPA